MASTLKGPLVNPSELFASVAPGSLGQGGVQVGAQATTGDGRLFRYVLAGSTALVAGKLYQSPAEDTTNLENLSIAAAAVGATSITTTSTVTLTANQAAGGYLTVAGTGSGYVYKIAGNTAATAATTVITLEDPLQVALTTSSKIAIALNPYSGVIVNPTTPTGAPVGVAVYPVNAGSYGWVQTRGPAAALVDTAALVVGQPVAASAATAGAVTLGAHAGGTTAIVGNAVCTVAAATYGVVFLTLE